MVEQNQVVASLFYCLKTGKPGRYCINMNLCRTKKSLDNLKIHSYIVYHEN